MIDFEKAFDSVSWEFMFKVLNFYNFGDYFIKFVEVFYKNIQSCVLVNGSLLEWFYVQRGCRQGDPLSPYLFILCAEMLAVLIRNNDNITGVKIGSAEFLISQYADDTTFILDGSEKSLETLFKSTKILCRCLRPLYKSRKKTKVVWIGSKSNCTEKLCGQYPLCWKSQEFTVLGITFTKDLKEIVEINYRTKLEDIKRLLVRWSKRILTPIGKITVIKSLALAKINHLILTLPNPPKETIKYIQNMFYKYLWSGGPDKIKRDIVTQPVNKGGLKMVDLEKFICSLKVTWIRRLLRQNSKCLYIFNTNFPHVTDCFKFGTSFIVNKRKYISTRIRYEYLEGPGSNRCNQI